MTSNLQVINRHLYCRILLLANSLPVTFTDKFHYFHKIRTSLEIILYLQIPILANSKTTGLQPNSDTCNFIQSENTR